MATRDTSSNDETETERHAMDEQPWEHASATHDWLGRYLAHSSPLLNLEDDECYHQFFEEQLRMDLLFGNVSESFAELARYNNSLPPPQGPVQFCRCEAHEQTDQDSNAQSARGEE